MPGIGDLTGLLGGGFGGISGAVGSGTIFRAYARTSIGGVTRYFLLQLDPSGVAGGTPIDNYLDVDNAAPQPDLKVRLTPNAALTELRIDLQPHQGRPMTGLELTIVIALDGDVYGGATVPQTFAFVEYRGAAVDGAPARPFPTSLTATLGRPAPGADETVSLRFATTGCVEPLWVEAGSFEGPLVAPAPSARTTTYNATTGVYAELLNVSIRAGDGQNARQALRAELRVRDRTPANLALTPLEVKVTGPYVIPRPPRTTSPALAGQGAGSVDRGAHSYRVTYVLRNGNETRPSLPTASVEVSDSAANGRVRLTAIPTGPSQGGQPLDVVARRIYRSRAGDRGEHFLVGEIGDNTAIEFTDNVADSALTDPLPGRARIEYLASTSVDLKAVLRTKDWETGAQGRIDVSSEQLPTTATAVYDGRSVPRLRYTADAQLALADVTLPTLEGPETTYARALVRILPTNLSAHWRADSEYRSVIELAGSALGAAADPIEELALVLSRGPASLPAVVRAVDVEVTEARDAAGATSRTALVAAVRRLRRARISVGEEGAGPADSDPSLILELGAQVQRALHVRANVVHADGVRDYTDLSLSALPDRSELVAITPRVVARPRRTTTPALAGQGAGSVDRGTHSYRVTYVLRNGNETGASLPTGPVEVTDPAANGRVRLTGVPVGPSQGNRPLDVVARRIYRSLAGDRGEHFRVGELTNNTATEFVDNIADSALTDPLPGRAKVTYKGSSALDAEVVLRTLDREVAGEKRVEAGIEGLPTECTIDYDNRASPRLRYAADGQLRLADVTLPTLEGPETTYARAVVRTLPRELTVQWRFDSEQKSLIELGGATFGSPADPISSLALVLSHGPADLLPGRQPVAIELIDQRQATGTITKLLTRAAVIDLRRLRLAIGEAGRHARENDGLKLLLAHGPAAAAAATRERSLRFLRHVDRHLRGTHEHTRLWIRAGSLPRQIELDLRATGDDYLGLLVQGAVRRLKVLSLSAPKNAWETDDARLWLAVPETGERVDFVSDPSGQRLVSDRAIGAELSLRDPTAPRRDANAFRRLKALLWLPTSVELNPARVVYGTADAGSTASQLVDAGAEFDPAWRRLQLRWRTGTLAGQRREVVAITDSTHLTTQPFGAAPAAGDQYALEGRPLEGTADTGSTASQLVDANGGFDTAWRDMTLTYTGGTQQGRTRKITAVADASRLTTEPFPAAPAAGDTYVIAGPSGLTLECGAGGGAAARVALGREPDTLLAVRATPQVRLRNAPLVGPASSPIHGATARVLGVSAFNLTSWGALTEAHAELEAGRTNKSFRVALQEQVAAGDPNRDLLKVRVSSLPPDAAILLGPGDGVYELRLSEPTGEGSLRAEPRQQRKETLRGPLAALIKRAPVALSPERGIGLLAFNFDAIPRGMRVTVLADASGAPFSDLGWSLPSGWEVPAIMLEASGEGALRFLRMISYSRDREAPWPPPSTFFWSRTDAKVISWSQQNPVAAPARPRLDPVFLWTPGEIAPANPDAKLAGIGFQISGDLRLTLDLDSYGARTGDATARWSSFRGTWQLGAELQMKDYSGTCLIVPADVGGPIGGGDEAAGPGTWFLRAVDARPWYVAGGSVFFGNTGTGRLSKPRIFQ